MLLQLAALLCQSAMNLLSPSGRRIRAYQSNAASRLTSSCFFGAPLTCCLPCISRRGTPWPQPHPPPARGREVQPCAHIQALPQRCARAPAGHDRDLGFSGLVEAAEQDWQAIRVLKGARLASSCSQRHQPSLHRQWRELIHPDPELS